MENTSKEFDAKKVKELVSNLEKEGNWTFTFLGADIDVFAEAVPMAFSAANIASFDKTSEGYRGATYKMSSGNTKFYNNRTAGIRNVSDFYGEGDTKDDKKIL